MREESNQSVADAERNIADEIRDHGKSSERVRHGEKGAEPEKGVADAGQIDVDEKIAGLVVDNGIANLGTTRKGCRAGGRGADGVQD